MPAQPQRRTAVAGTATSPEELEHLASQNSEWFAVWYAQTTGTPDAVARERFPTYQACKAFIDRIREHMAWAPDMLELPPGERAGLIVESVRTVSGAYSPVHSPPKPKPRAKPETPAAKAIPPPKPKHARGETAKRNNATRAELNARLQAKTEARRKRKAGRRSTTPPAEILKLARTEAGGLHPKAEAILQAMWEFSRVETFKLDAQGRIWKPDRGQPRTVRLRVWAGSINGLAVWLKMPRRTLSRHLKRIDERGRCYVLRLQRGYPAFTAKARSQNGAQITPPNQSIFALGSTARSVNKARATRRDVCEGLKLNRTRATRRTRKARE